MIIYDKHIASSFSAVSEAVHEIDTRITLICDLMQQSTLFKINFMLREMLNNAVEHGNHFDEDKKVHCVVAFEEHFMYFYITDEGSGIDLTCNPYHEECEITLSNRNRGYATVKELNFDVHIEGNRVSVSLDLSQEGGLCKKK